MRKCKPSWLDAYIQYTQNQEAPTTFHEWVGIAVLSATIGRHVWIPRIKYVIFPNLFIILVAGSAQSKKSTAINIGTDLLRGMEHPPMIFAQKITTEALIQALESAKIEGASAGIICASELSVFMGPDVRKSGIVPALTDLYDSPKEWIYHTRSRGKEVLRNVTLTILAASTKEWLKSSIPTDSIGGGFTSRIIFVYQDRGSRPILFHDETPLEMQLKGDLIHDLNDMRGRIRGPMEFTPKAKEVAEEWYKGEWNIMRDSKLEGYFARKHDTMFKIASLLSVGEGESRMIEPSHIKRALHLLNENERSLDGIMASVVATVIGGEMEQVLTIIQKHGSVKHTDLLRRCWRFTTAEGLGIMLKTLIESGEIIEELGKDGRTRHYRVGKGG